MKDPTRRHFLWVIIGNTGILLLGVVVLAVSIYVLVRPGIAITVPIGGEEWALGSTHTLSWSTYNAPGKDKLAISIRRLAPPPLQSEGQEFDPIVFTDVPASAGRIDWTISDMYPTGTYVLEFHAYASLPMTDDISVESAPFQIVPAPLSQDLYPLYDKVDWGAPEKEYFTIGSTTYIGTTVISETVTGTTDPASIFSPFEKYYADKLRSLGWKVDNAMAAGGHVGGQTGYRKGNELALVRFRILYHTVTETAPSSCPCDVMVSLFSTKVGK